MNELLIPAVKAIQERFSASLSEFRDEATLLIDADKVTAAAGVLRDEFDFDLLSAETAVDYYPQTHPRFHVVYIFYSTKNKVYLTFRAPVEGDDPKIDTLERVYPNANWREREIWDLFGIHFNGHSDLRRILMPPKWVGHPLRKDYPLGYEEVQFSFNFDEIDVSKPKGEK